MKHLREPVEKLRVDRRVEAVESAQPNDVFGMRARRHHHGDRIARDHAQQDEHD